MDKSLQNVIKHDQFIETVEGATDYVSHHKKQVFLYLAIAIVLAVAGYFGWRYMEDQKRERQQALGAAVGLTATVESRNDEAVKKISAAYQQVINKYPGSNEANTAKYVLATIELEQGDAAKGEKMLREILNGDKETVALAKYALADYAFGQGKTDEAEKFLRELLASPTYMVPKEQTTLQLGRVIAKTKPEEARKLLEPLRSARAPISTPALEILGTLPAAAPTPAPAKK